jgi:hypothetical protein
VGQLQLKQVSKAVLHILLHPWIVGSAQFTPHARCKHLTHCAPAIAALSSSSMDGVFCQCFSLHVTGAHQTCICCHCCLC